MCFGEEDTKRECHFHCTISIVCAVSMIRLFFSAALSLVAGCRAWGLLSCSSGRLPMVVACLAKHRLLGVQASVVVARGLVVAAHGLSFPVACGIFLGQG